jgi:hypothetical protein
MKQWDKIWDRAYDEEIGMAEVKSQESVNLPPAFSTGP